MAWTQEEIRSLKKKYPNTPTDELSEEMGKTVNAIRTKCSRLGIHKDASYRLQKKMDKIPEPEFKDEGFALFLMGFTAGEGAFVHRTVEGGRKRFSFQISVSQVDTDVIRKIKKFIGAGKIYMTERRKQHWCDEIHYAVQSIPVLVKVIIPLFDQFGLHDTHKQEQYKEWKGEILKYCRKNNDAIAG